MSAAVNQRNRRAVCELAHYLGTHGNDASSAIHMAVTEGRAKWYPSVGSTSCGDLLHCVLYAAGCREAIINREEHTGWRAGQNLYLFTPPLRNRKRLTDPSLSDLRPGDLGIYDYRNGRAHGFVYLGIDKDGNAVTADAGQPGIKIYHCSVHRSHGKTWLRDRPFDFAIDLDSLVFDAAPDTVGEWCDRNGLPIQPWTPAEYLYD